MLQTIHALRDISRRCAKGEPLTSGQLQWLGQSLTGFLLHRHPTIEEAMGLRFPRGGVPWWLEIAMRERDAALRDLASRHFAGLPVVSQAREIRTLTIRYQASAWRHDRNAAAMPAHYAGTAYECLWRAFAAGARMPIADRRLRQILSR